MKTSQTLRIAAVIAAVSTGTLAASAGFSELDGRRQANIDRIVADTQTRFDRVAAQVVEANAIMAKLDVSIRQDLAHSEHWQTIED